MEFNYSKIIIFLIIFIGSIFGYYKYMLKAEEGENKSLKLLKRVLILIIILGVIHLYSIAESPNIKYIFVQLLLTSEIEFRLTFLKKGIHVNLRSRKQEINEAMFIWLLLKYFLICLMYKIEKNKKNKL